MDDSYALLASEKAKLQKDLSSQYASKSSLTKTIGNLTQEISQLQQYLLLPNLEELILMLALFQIASPILLPRLRILGAMLLRLFCGIFLRCLYQSKRNEPVGCQG
jgi:hypothetical protein